MPIALHLDFHSKKTLQTQIYEQLVSYIRERRLKPGSALPSSRDLSEQLGVSRNTVSEAYEKLAADGYVNTAPAKGTFVSDAVPEDAMCMGAIRIIERSSPSATINLPLPYGGRGHPGLYSPPDTEIRIDYHIGRSDPRSFPEKMWRRLLLECLGGAAERISQYNDPAGMPELRQLIAEYLGPARGISVSPEQVIIVGGFQQGINLAAHLMVGVNTPVLIEAPCYRGAAFLFETYGAKMIPVRVDEFGIDVECLPNHGVKLIYVTPSHQFPTGSTMSLERRLALLEWAARTNAYILEVDYDSDFRYEGTLLPSLHSLDSNKCVIYLNSFSRSLGPGLRLGYMVVPADLLSAATTLKALIDNGSPWLEQAAMAQFIQNGSLTAHLKRLRNTYRSRRDAVRSSIRRHFGEATISGYEAGTHMLWTLPATCPPASDLQRLARRAEVGLHPLQAGTVLYADILPGYEHRILLGYVHLQPERIEEGFGRIADILATSGYWK
jgi:GntR family transcriptional regulator / MocR family aminotransferase